jgi:hypothetical protein
MKKFGRVSVAATCFMVWLATPAFAGSELPPPGSDVGGVVIHPPGAAPGTTAFTGSGLNVTLWMVLTAALFIAGLLLLVASRRRRMTTAA